MSGPWQVHLAPDATTVLRDASKSATKIIAVAIDTLAARGPDAVVAERDGNEWTGTVVAGDYLITAAGRDGDNRIVVVSITLSETTGARAVADLLPVKQATRRSIGGFLHGFDLDVRYTIRSLRRTPLFTAMVIGALAVGLGGATAMLDVVHTVYRSALPFGNDHELVRIRNANASSNGQVRRYNLTHSDFEFLRDNNRSFESVVAQEGHSLSLLTDGPAERIGAIAVSPRWAQTLQIKPLLGRTFAEDEERAGADAGVALISHGLWQRHFGGDSSVLGRELHYDGGALTIIGVMPANIKYPYDSDVWTPWAPSATNATSGLNVFARLAKNTTLSRAQSDADRMHRDRQDANLHRSATGFDVATLRADFIRDEARTLQALSAAVVFVLVLAFVNVANLLVARFTTRRGELGLRAALGGRRDQQVRQMLVETTALFVAGAAGGVLIGMWLRTLLSVIIPDNFRTELGLGSSTIDAGIIATIVALGLSCGLVVGAFVAWRALRADPMTLVRESARTSMGRADKRVFDVLVAAQLGLSLVLLVGASLLITRFRDLSQSDPGYVLDGVTTMRLTLAQARYDSSDARNQLVHALEERIAAVPGVDAVGITTVNPLCCGDWGAPIEVEGRPVAPNEPATLVAHSFVTPGYFRAMSMPLLRGTGFAPDARPGMPATVVVDEYMAKMLWPGEEAVGKRIRLARPDQPWRTVVGVVPTTEHEAEMRASWFLPYHEDPRGPSAEQLHIMVKSATTIPVAALLEVVRSIDPALAVYGVASMLSLQSERTSQDRLGAIISTVFAVFGLVLAAFSIYGLLSYSVELRRGEIGVRMALGASRVSIVRMVMAQAAARLLFGMVAGVALALAANQLLRNAIEGLPWVPVQTLVGLALLMAAVTCVAAMVPAVRASKVDPIRALRA